MLENILYYLKYLQYFDYIKYKNDFSIIEETCRECFGNIPMVFIQADICRNDLLVEIEGEVIL